MFSNYDSLAKQSSVLRIWCIFFYLARFTIFLSGITVILRGTFLIFFKVSNPTEVNLFCWALQDKPKNFTLQKIKARFEERHIHYRKTHVKLALSEAWVWVEYRYMYVFIYLYINVTNINIHFWYVCRCIQI